MGRRIVVVSVPHTGSEFASNLLAEHCYHLDHVDADRLARLRAMLKDLPCVVPMRHPRSVALSWCARIPNNPEYYRVDSMCDYFRRLVLAIDPFEPYYLPLDVDDRDSWLDRINTSLGLDLKTDWPVVHSIGKQGQFCGNEEALIDELMDELKGFFERFGYT